MKTADWLANAKKKVIEDGAVVVIMDGVLKCQNKDPEDRRSTRGMAMDLAAGLRTAVEHGEFGVDTIGVIHRHFFSIMYDGLTKLVEAKYPTRQQFDSAWDYIFSHADWDCQTMDELN